MRVHTSTDAHELTALGLIAQSAFSTFLHEMGANFYEIFAPDLMHEFELGVWKGIFNHILRILVAEGKEGVATFNAR